MNTGAFILDEMRYGKGNMREAKAEVVTKNDFVIIENPPKFGSQLV